MLTLGSSSRLNCTPEKGFRSSFFLNYDYILDSETQQDGDTQGKDSEARENPFTWKELG
jgi:hypothetical protein